MQEYFHPKSCQAWTTPTVRISTTYSELLLSEFELQIFDRNAGENLKFHTVCCLVLNPPLSPLTRNIQLFSILAIDLGLFFAHVHSILIFLFLFYLLLLLEFPFPTRWHSFHAACYSHTPAQIHLSLSVSISCLNPLSLLPQQNPECCLQMY